MSRSPFLLTTLVAVGGAALAAAGAAACNPYDPVLGDVPFRCGTDEPRCPDGYVCVAHSETRQLCERSADVPDVDAGPDPEADAGEDLDCDSDRSLEPNDTLQTAWTTPIPARMDEVALIGLSICPETDVDVYRFGIDVAGKNLRATINTDLSRGPLTVEILNSSGTVIQTGTPTGADNVVEVRVPNMSVGTWYARVGATTGVTNNYSIEIKTCSGSPACLD